MPRRISQVIDAQSEESGDLRCKLEHAVQIELGLRRESPKNGNIRGSRRRLLPKWPPSSRIWSAETCAQLRKPAKKRALLTVGGRYLRLRECLAGAKGFRTSMWRVRNQMLSPIREEPQNRSSLKFTSSSKTFEFREPYRIFGVQSSGEKWAIRRIMRRLCRSGVRSSDEKSLLLEGLIANKFTRRINGFGQAGGGRGTGIEPSPRTPTWRKVIQRTAAPGGLSLPRRRLQIDGQAPQAAVPIPGNCYRP